jgi:hypothetical protein
LWCEPNPQPPPVPLASAASQSQNLWRPLWNLNRCCGTFGATETSTGNLVTDASVRGDTSIAILFAIVQHPLNTTSFVQTPPTRHKLKAVEELQKMEQLTKRNETPPPFESKQTNPTRFLESPNLIAFAV